MLGEDSRGSDEELYRCGRFAALAGDDFHALRQGGGLNTRLKKEGKDSHIGMELAEMWSPQKSRAASYLSTTDPCQILGELEDIAMHDERGPIQSHHCWVPGCVFEFTLATIKP